MLGEESDGKKRVDLFSLSRAVEMFENGSAMETDRLGLISRLVTVVVALFVSLWQVRDRPSA